MIDRDSIHVWQVRLDALAALPMYERAARLESWRAMLSAEERRRAGAFASIEHGEDYIAAHAALRFVLGVYLRVVPSSIEIGPSDGTKPTLAATWGEGANNRDFPQKEWPDLRFNLSHTRGAVLIGIATGRELGVDIEWQRPMEDLEGMARSVMSDGELSQWNVLGLENRMRAFYHVWTRKESYLCGYRPGALPQSSGCDGACVSADALEDSAKDSRVVLDRSGEGTWSVLDVPAWKGYSASICWEGLGVPRLTVRNLDIVG